MVVLVPLAAAAQSSPYCRKVRARAAGDAALLMSPRVVVQGIRFPSNGQVEATAGVLVGAGYQARAGVSFSPLEFYRGAEVIRLGDADCDQHDALESIRETISQGADAARASAPRAQADYLEGHRDELRSLATRAEQRLAARLITVVEFQELRQKCNAVERKLVEIQAEAKILRAKGEEPPRESVGALAERYEKLAMRFERETSRLRSLDAWHFQLTGGVVPLAPVDWYGLAEVSYNPGGVVRNQRESRYLEARDDELRRSPYEPGPQSRELRAQLAAALELARSNLDIDDRDAAAIDSATRALEHSTAPDAAHARDFLAIEGLSIQSDRVFFHKWIESLWAMLEAGHGF
ncbi:MAG TPA: hypothetical protein VN894_18505 [Polyangiaceae bacterium]|nr:hypothetical protein [Polyangiaceae bacterium]